MVTTDNVLTTSVSQNHLDGKYDSDVSVIFATNQTLHYLPAGLNDFFPNIRGLTILHSQLRRLTTCDIASFENLQFVYAYGNNIQLMDGDLFSKNTNVSYVSFTKNPVSHIGSNLLAPLKELKEAYFGNCHCIDQLAWNSAQITKITSDMKVFCPPTFGMLLKDVLIEKGCISDSCLNFDEFSENSILKDLIDRIENIEKELQEQKQCKCKCMKNKIV